jgi:hypothetical protein
MQRRYGQARCVQAVIGSAAACASGVASTGALGAESTVKAAAIAAANMTAVVVFSMMAPCLTSGGSVANTQQQVHRMTGRGS